MNVLLLNGSPHKEGNTARALAEMKQVFESEGITVHEMHIGQMPIRSCIACGRCDELRKCVFDDAVNEAAALFEQADGLVAAAPVYYAAANPTLSAFMTRLFYSTPFDKRMKVGAAVVAARRGGASAAFDEINKFFTISGMPIASSQYWNSIHGCVPGEAQKDLEGLQVMRALASNMSFLIKSIALGKEKYGLPAREKRVSTNFIR